LVTVALLATMLAAGVHPNVSQAVSAAAGLGVVALLLLRAEPSPLREAIATMAGLLARRPAETPPPGRL
jgi:hypothetical protein